MISKSQFDEVRKALLPIAQEKCIKSIWISNYEEASNTLKVNILVDDTFTEEKSLREVKNLMAFASTKTSEMGINFMPVRRLSRFLELLKHGEQLAMSTLSGVILVYDPAGYIRMLNGLMHKGEIYSSEQRAKKLLEKAKEKLAAANYIMLNEITNESYLAMVESAQAALMYAGKHPGNEESLASELSKCFSNILNQSTLDSLKEAYAISERMKKEQKAFTTEDVEKVFTKSKEFTKQMQDTVTMFESESEEKFIDETFRHTIKKCSELLNIPITSESDMVNSFKRRFLETGMASQDQYQTLLNLYQYSKSSKKEKAALTKSKFLDRSHLQSLRISMEELSN